MSEIGQPHPENVQGPFYVLNGCCMACDVPVSEAPDLFTYDVANHCYVKRQPHTKEEFERTLRVAWSAEVECIRYRGVDPEVLRRFAEFGSPHLCDVAPPPEILPVIRDFVRFDSDSPEHAQFSAVDLVEAFRGHLLHLDSLREDLGTRFRYHFNPIEGGPLTASLTYSWFEDHRHTVEFQVVGVPGFRWVTHHFSAELIGGRAVSLQIDDWLKGAGSFRPIQWYSAEEWAGRGAGRDSPQ